VASDSCPRPGQEKWIEIGLKGTVHLAGNTGSMTDDYSSFCGGGQDGHGADVVYPVRATARGTLSIDAMPGPYQPVVYVESECGVRSTLGMPVGKLPCLDEPSEQIRLGVTAGQELYVIVDGQNAAGEFDVALHLEPPECGDGVVNPTAAGDGSEQCDLGMGSSGGGGAGGAGGGGSPGAGGNGSNGCTASCQFEPPGADDTCPGVPVGALPASVAGYTLGYGDDYGATCAPAGGPDRVYSVGAKQGTLHVQLDADFDAVVSVYDSCAQAQALACHDSPDPAANESFDVTIPIDGTYYVVVDGFDAANWGTFTLQIDQQ